MPGVKNIYTVHDLIPMRLPFTTLDHNQRFVRMVEWIAKTADHIVTVSETSKRDIVNLLGVPEEKVSTTYQSVEIPARYLDKAPDVVASEVKGIFGLDYKGYYLFFGAIEPKKNVGRLIQGYLASGVEEPLVVLGGDAWLADKELSLLAGDYLDHLRSLVTVGDITQTRRKVRRFSYAPFPILISLIKGAKAVVAPSLYEGFGLPALESMLCGTPVITTKEGASSEIVDDAALLVDPYDPNDIRDAILAMNNNPELSAELVQRGRRRAKLFSRRNAIGSSSPSFMPGYDHAQPNELARSRVDSALRSRQKTGYQRRSAPGGRRGRCTGNDGHGRLVDGCRAERRGRRNDGADPAAFRLGAGGGLPLCIRLHHMPRGTFPAAALQVLVQRTQDASDDASQTVGAGFHLPDPA
jgi:hypothetical protein